MKSIMEESRTIAKAIEAAWNRAGKPAEFTVKVLELPQTAFFGLKTVKSAKISFFFTERVAPKYPARAQVRPQRGAVSSPSSPSGHRDESPARPHGRQDGRQDYRQSPRMEDHVREPQPAREAQPRRFDSRHTDRPEPRPHNGRREQYVPREGTGAQREGGSSLQSWNETMVATATDWVKDALNMMGHGSVVISPHVSHNYLKIRLSEHVGTDAQQEEMLLKSWGSLAMESVREKAQQPLRHLRVIVEGKR